MLETVSNTHKAIILKTTDKMKSHVHIEQNYLETL